MDKRNITYLRPWWWAAIVGQHYVFETPLSVEACQRIIFDKNERVRDISLIGIYNRTSITSGLTKYRYQRIRYKHIHKLRTEIEKSGDFKLIRISLGGFTAEIIGKIERKRFGTRVEVYGRITPIWGIIFLCFHALIMLPPLFLTAWPYGILVSLFYILAISLDIRTRNRLTYLPYQFLVVEQEQRHDG